MVAPIENLTGRKFGRLLVGELSEIVNDRRAYRCECECGNVVKARPYHLVNGQFTSCGCGRRLPFGDSTFNTIYRDYQNNAKTSNRKFDLTKEHFRELVQQDCYYCGAAPSRVRKAKGRGYGEFTYNGIDRVDNAKDYEPSNVVPCCYKCNLIKLHMSVDMARKIVDFIDGKNPLPLQEI
jgi:hypothetical protein